MILVQHEDESIREIVSSMLAPAGYECQGVESTKKVWDTLESDATIELVLCKVFESLEDGLIERVANRFPRVRIITWGSRPEELFLESIRRGAHNYLQLPFEPEELLALVRRTLDNHIPNTVQCTHAVDSSV